VSYRLVGLPIARCVVAGCVAVRCRVLQRVFVVPSGGDCGTASAAAACVDVGTSRACRR